MANYDEDIVLTLGLNTDDARKSAINSAKDIQKQMNDALAGGDGSKQSTARLDKINVKLANLLEKAEQIGNTPVVSEEFKELLDMLNQYEKEMDKLQIKLAKVQSFKVANPEWDKLQQEIKDTDMFLSMVEKNARAAMEQISRSVTTDMTDRFNKGWFIEGKKLKNLEELEGPIERRTQKLFMESEAYQNLIHWIEKAQELQSKVETTPEMVFSKPELVEQTEQEIANLQARIDQTTDSIREMSEAGEDLTLGTSTEEYSEAVQKVNMSANDARVALEKYNEENSNLESTISSSLIPSLQKLALSLVRIGWREVKKSMSRIKDALRGVGNAAEDAQKNFKHLMHNFLRYVIGVRSLYFLFRKIRSAINDSFDEMAKFGGVANSVNADIVNFRNSLTSLKNAWGAAFGQALSFVLPVLNAIIGAATRAASALAGFFSLLTGKKVYMAVQSGQGAVGGSAKKATKALKDEEDQAKKTKDRLADFDDLDVLGKDDDDTMLDGLGDDLDDLGGGGGGGAETAFEEIPIADWIKELWEKILKAWQEGEDAMYDLFYEFGRKLGDALLDALTNLNGKWPAIQGAARKIAAAIAGFINGFFETQGLANEIGTAIAEMLNTAIYFAQTLIHRLHFDSIGKFIGDGIREALLGINWNALADVLATGINKIFDFIRGFDVAMEFADGWTQFGTKVRDAIYKAIEDIKWVENGQILGNAIKNLIDALSQFLNQDTVNRLADAIAEFLEQLPWSDIVKFALELFTFELRLQFGIVRNLWNDLVSDTWDEMDTDPFRRGARNGGAAYRDELELQKDQNRESAVSSFLDPITEAIQQSELAGAAELPEKFKGKVSENKGVMYDSGKELVDETSRPFAEADTLPETTAFAQNLQTNLETSLANTPMDESSRIIIQALSDALQAGSEDIMIVVQTVLDSIKELIFLNLDTMREEITAKLTEDFTLLMTTWWETQLLPWFSPDKWSAELLDPLHAYFETRWTTFLTWWDTKTKDWWEKHVKVWFEQKKWQEQFENIQKAAEEVFPKIEECITTNIETARDNVIEACNAMKEAIASVMEAISELNEAIAGIGSGVNFSFSASVPHLASGAVIPPNNKFLAVLGDQTRGTNIEAPLDTIVDAFRSVVGNMEVQNSGYAEMELDGEVFARLITPYVVSELNRQGYNVNVLEG